MEGAVRCSANYVPLSPISFLERAASVYRDRTSIVYGSTVKYTWKETRERCVKLASALAQLGISRGDIVAVLAPNVPAVYELHFSIPMAGAVICPLNTLYDSAMVSILLKHTQPKILFVDYQFYDVARAALDDLILTSNNTKTNLPLLVLIPESDIPSEPTVSKTIISSASSSGNYLEYESLLATGQNNFEIIRPNDEWDPISLNYTSGTTSSRPKEVIYNHRGAYLNSLSAILLTGMRTMPTYLWTVPMFHCNGWCLAWGVAAQGGTNICLRNVSAQVIFDSIALHKVTNMGGAPTILNIIANAPPSIRKPLPGKVEIFTGGATPPPEVLLNVEKLGFCVTHAYGMTEAYGPGTVCTWMPEWELLPPNERAFLKARHGVQHLGMEEVDIKDPVTMKSVPADAKTMGEVMFRGNTVMSGYYKNLKATEEAFKGGWYRTGDFGVKHPDGYIEIKDRSQDIIISGEEHFISTIEVENVLFSHPSILEAAVVGRPDDRWGETPCAFVKLKEGHDADAQEIIKYCGDRLAHYMVPRTVVFDDLPKTSTGKTQKYVLREKAKAMGSLTEMTSNI